MFNYEPAVAKGAAWLDEVGPADWRERVTSRGPLTGVAMEGIHTCIIGRVYGRLGAQPHELMKGELEDYGFNGSFDDRSPDTFMNLANEWNKILFPQGVPA